MIHLETLPELQHDAAVSVVLIQILPLASNYFPGNINYLRIWNQNISYDQLIEFGNGYSSNNFFADYKFNSSEGEILYDHSGNQNHGIIVGATWEEIEVETVLGCTDPLAINYDINANSDDGTCSYPDNGSFSLALMPSMTM